MPLVEFFSLNRDCIFTDLKKNLNNHSGLTLENCKRFILVFLTYRSFHLMTTFFPL